MNCSFNQSEKMGLTAGSGFYSSEGLEFSFQPVWVFFTFMVASGPITALISNKTLLSEKEWKSRTTGHAPLKQQLYSPQQQSLYMLICLQYLWSTCWWRFVSHMCCCRETLVFLDFWGSLHAELERADLRRTEGGAQTTQLERCKDCVCPVTAECGLGGWKGGSVPLFHIII